MRISLSEEPSHSIKDAVNNITASGFRVELPDADVTNAGPVLFDVPEIVSAIPATFGPGPFTQGPTPRRGGDGETLEPRTAEGIVAFLCPGGGIRNPSAISRRGYRGC